jgi:hypothetical protein
LASPSVCVTCTGVSRVAQSVQCLTTDWTAGIRSPSSAEVKKERSYTSCHPNAPLWSVTVPLYVFFTFYPAVVPTQEELHRRPRSVYVAPDDAFSAVLDRFSTALTFTGAGQAIRSIRVNRQDIVTVRRYEMFNKG